LPLRWAGSVSIVSRRTSEVTPMTGWRLAKAASARTASRSAANGSAGPIGTPASLRQRIARAILAQQQARLQQRAPGRQLRARIRRHVRQRAARPVRLAGPEPVFRRRQQRHVALAAARRLRGTLPGLRRGRPVAGLLQPARRGPLHLDLRRTAVEHARRATRQQRRQRGDGEQGLRTTRRPMQHAG
jgi:hypothetical protein